MTKDDLDEDEKDSGDDIYNRRGVKFV